MTASMSRKGNGCGNARVENFWGTLKDKLEHHRRYENREQARGEIADYPFIRASHRSAAVGDTAPIASTSESAPTNPPFASNTGT